MKRALLITILMIPVYIASGQDWQAIRDSINRLSYMEHQSTLEMLGIESLRPGPSGNPASPNAANSDESKAKTYDRLPELLRFEDGTTVDTPQDWEKRKDELHSLFSNEMYGKVPENVPEVTWEVVSEKDTMIGRQHATETKLAGVLNNSSFPAIEVKIDLTIFLPGKTNRAVPLIMEFGWNFPGFSRRENDGPTWKEQLLAEGWGAAVLVPTSYQADHGGGLREGVIGLTNKGEMRNPDEWGALRAWAWGASGAMDYFESTSAIDASRVGIEGLSRYGKAAIVTMVYDSRFAIALVGSSGAGGAKILRRNFGEQVENLASSAEFHWFAPNFIKYAGPLNVNDLPVDAHQLIALCAPRPVFISTGDPSVEGNWVDAKGMFLATAKAGGAYELTGASGLSTNEYPGTGIFLNSGNLAFRQHEGGHTVTPNWPYFIEFAKNHFSE